VSCEGEVALVLEWIRALALARAQTCDSEEREAKERALDQLQWRLARLCRGAAQEDIGNAG
jgi:hypothetical protein